MTNQEFVKGLIEDPELAMVVSRFHEEIAAEEYQRMKITNEVGSQTDTELEVFLNQEFDVDTRRHMDKVIKYLDKLYEIQGEVTLFTLGEYDDTNADIGKYKSMYSIYLYEEKETLIILTTEPWQKA